MSICPRTNKECKHYNDADLIAGHKNYPFCEHPKIGKRLLGGPNFRGYHYTVQIRYLDDFINEYMS